MRLSVASTGGGAGSASTGKAARRKARYSSTGSTTQPSPEGTAFCAEPAAAAKTIASARQSALIAITAVVGAHLCVRPDINDAAGGFERGRRDAKRESRFISVSPIK